MLKTNVDKILDILKEKKELMISDLALMLNATPSNIEKIAKLLEEEKLLTIKYKMMKPYLVYGFKEKVRGEEKGKEKKPLFIWKKKIIPSTIPTQTLMPLEKKSFLQKLFKKKEKTQIPQATKKSFLSKIFKKKEIKPIPAPFLAKKEEPKEIKSVLPPKPPEKLKQIEKKSLFQKLFRKKEKKEEIKPSFPQYIQPAEKKEIRPIPILRPIIKQQEIKQIPKPQLTPLTPKKEEIKPIPKFKKPFLSKIFKKKEEPISVFPKTTDKPEFKNIKLKKKPFSGLFRRKDEDLNEVKEAINLAKGNISLEKKPIKPVFDFSKFQRPVELKRVEVNENERSELAHSQEKEETEEDDIKKELNNLINEIKKNKEKNLIERNYKKALALYSKLKDTDNRIEYNNKLKQLYYQLKK